MTFDVGDEVARKRSEDPRGAGRALERIRLIAKLAPTWFQYAALGLIIGVIWLLWAIDYQNLGVIGPLILLLVRALAYARQLQGATQSVIHYSPYVERLELEIAELRAHPVLSGSRSLTELGTVAFEAVTFEYIAGTPVLLDVNLEIGPHDSIGVVGPSGGGKSTLTQLLLRLRHPTSGRILVGDVDLRDVEQTSWSRLAALVPQENRLIRGTVADNIRFYRSGFSMDDVERAARSAHLHNEIVALPEGYETDIGPGARDLSGGQRQRLGIAHALLGKPQLLVLDEPTSALDVRSEELIRQTLAELRGTTALVVVAHRPATLEVCDRVIRVDRGRVFADDAALAAAAKVRDAAFTADVMPYAAGE